MKSFLDASLAEESFLSEIRSIDEKISQLKIERKVLEQALMRKRRLSVNKSEAFRQNSFNRIYIENLIISILREAPKPLANRFIFELLTKEHVEIKATTFRALLFRMKEKGILENRNRKWQLAQNKTAP